METQKEARKLKVKCLVETLSTHLQDIPFFSRWEKAHWLGSEGVCSLEEANDYVREQANLKHDNLDSNPASELVDEKTSGHSVIYTLRDIPSPDSYDARHGNESYIHIRITPRFQFEEPKPKKGLYADCTLQRD